MTNVNDREFLEGLSAELYSAGRKLDGNRLLAIVRKLPITHFRGKYSFLSNFYLCGVDYNGYIWKSAEHAYQGSKAKYGEEEDMVFHSETPGEAKRMGHKITLKDSWCEAESIKVMKKVLTQKFQNEELRKKLLDTGDARLIEGNSWGDAFWGVPEGEIGQNILGKCLMSIRSKCREESTVYSVLDMRDQHEGEVHNADISD